MSGDALWVLRYLMQERTRPVLRSRDALRREQDARVHAHLTWVMRRSPYYQRHFQGLNLREWQALPTTDKASMMANFDALNTAGVRLRDALALAERAERDRDFRPVLGPYTVGLSSATSGSRGVFLVSPDERRRWAASVLHALLPGSLLAPQRVAFFLRANSNLYTSVTTRQLSFTFFDLLRPVEAQFAALGALNPTVLVAPPSALRFLAEHAPASLAPLRVVSVAEVLEPQDRAVIEGRWGMAYEVYQATEGFLGVSCAHGRVHLNERHLAVNLEDAGQGRFTPVITDFTRRTQPIIRYRLNDLLVPADACPCGLVTQALSRIEGRSDDVLLLPAAEGGVRRVYPDFIRRALMRVPGAEEYRVRQVGAAALEVEVLPARPDVQAAAATALGACWAELGVGAVAVTFCPYRFTPGVTKLRRVQRLWSPT